MDVRKALAALVALAASTGQAAPARYAEGQVWEYRTRAGDEGSLIKIQRIEKDPALAVVGPIFHISVIGFRFRNPRVAPVLPHAPVSLETLNRSVTRPGRAGAAFPDPDPGIAEWRRAQGGVYTIGVAEIIGLLDEQTASLTD